MTKDILLSGGSQAINFDYTHLITVSDASNSALVYAYGYAAPGVLSTGGVGSVKQENIYPGDSVTLTALYYDYKHSKATRALVTINSSQWYIRRQGFKTITPPMLDADGYTPEVIIFSESDVNKRIPVWIASVPPPWD